MWDYIFSGDEEENEYLPTRLDANKLIEQDVTTINYFKKSNTKKKKNKGKKKKKSVKKKGICSSKIGRKTNRTCERIQKTKRNILFQGRKIEIQIFTKIGRS